MAAKHIGIEPLAFIEIDYHKTVIFFHGQHGWRHFMDRLRCRRRRRVTLAAIVCLGLALEIERNKVLFRQG